MLDSHRLPRQRQTRFSDLHDGPLLWAPEVDDLAVKIRRLHYRQQPAPPRQRDRPLGAVDLVGPGVPGVVGAHAGRWLDVAQAGTGARYCHDRPDVGDARPALGARWSGTCNIRQQSASASMLDHGMASAVTLPTSGGQSAHVEKERGGAHPGTLERLRDCRLRGWRHGSLRRTSAPPGARRRNGGSSTDGTGYRRGIGAALSNRIPAPVPGARAGRHLQGSGRARRRTRPGGGIRRGRRLGEDRPRGRCRRASDRLADPRSPGNRTPPGTVTPPESAPIAATRCRW
jgi:hypothetical protein